MKHTDKSRQQNDTTSDVIEGETTNSDSSEQQGAKPAETEQPPTPPEQPATAEPETPPSQDNVIDTPPPPLQSNTAEEVPKHKHKRSKLAVLAFLLALIALAICGYGYTLLQKLHGEMQSETAQLAQSLQQNQQAASNADRRAAALEQQLKQARQQSSAQQSNVNELQDRLTRAMQQISAVGTSSRRDWLLAEVEYLLRLANQRVLMEQSPVGALTLLESADKILKETDDVSIYNVRKALAKDITALEAVPRLDVDGTFLRLAALNQQIDSLRLLPVSDRHQLPDMLKEITPDSVGVSWQQGMQSSWSKTMDKLGSLIVIQHHDEPVEPLLSPQQNFFLKQNLHLMLEQAQLALLQGNQASYTASLAKAGTWIKTYFQEDDSTTQALVKGIGGLENLQVAPPLPDISASLTQLKAYLTALHKGKGAA